MSARDQVLATIRRSLGVNGEERPRRKIVEDRLAQHPSGLIPERATGKSPAERIRLFVEMAEASASTVSIVRSADDAPAAIADFLRAHNLAPAIRRGEDARLAAMPWGRTTLDVTVGRSFGDDPVGVSAAFGGVAETGTLVMVSGADNPSTLNLLPDNHVIVVDVADIDATYEDVWSRIRARYGAGVLPRTVNWITGPSRSADIEQILLMGAHGPRRLHVVLIDSNAVAEPQDRDRSLPAGSTPSPAIVRSTLPEGGEKKDDMGEPQPKDDREPAEEDETLDEELDESFPASDPPSQTQP